jgi:hypothetical protein
MKCTIQNTGSEVTDAAVHVLRNGGYQAVNIALLAGAGKVVLIGYDMKYGAGGKSHWHDGHPLKVPEQWYTQQYARSFVAFADCGVPVLNASLDTAIKALPRVPLEEALQ